MQRNQLLGGITRVVMCLLDYRTTQLTALHDDMMDNDITFKDLRENKEFLNGVMSGFFLDAAVEKWFWALVEDKNHELPPPQPILEVDHEDPANMDHVDEGVNVIAPEVEEVVEPEVVGA